jgi:hypothetical protein
MILISHRGNIIGSNKLYENTNSYIDNAINLGYDVEIDIWIVENKIFMCHDNPNNEIELEWLKKRYNKLWIHCKNLTAIEFFSYYKHFFNYFWHKNDDVTITSQGFLWGLPGKQPIKNSIAVMPEIFNDDVSKCIGICSDIIEKYKK